MDRLVSILGETKRRGHSHLEGTKTVSGNTSTGTEVREKDTTKAAADDYDVSLQKEVEDVNAEDDDDEKTNVSVSVSLIKTSTTASVEEKAARIERLKSGFRICRPQGSFLWPNSSSSRSQLSDSQRVAVDELLVVPTPPSVTSYISISQLSDHQPPPLDAPALTSPVKPFAEKGLVEMAPHSSDITEEKKVLSSSKINLNEFPNNNNPSSIASITYRRRSSNTTGAGFRNPTPSVCQ